MPHASILRTAVLIVTCILVAPGMPMAQSPSTIADAKSAFRRPTAVPYPTSNPYSDAKAALGAALFFDPRLSGPGTMSCATCHHAGLAWQDGLRLPTGVTGIPMARSTPTLLNVAWADSLMWDGRKDDLESQAAGPAFDPKIMGGSADLSISRIAALPTYRDAFESAFGDATVTFPHIAQAIATFERSLVSGRAPFDRWIDGDEQAISDNAKHGFTLFVGCANCAACHSGWRLTDDGFHDVGLNDADPGRGRMVPDVAVLQHAFKTPTLRNVDQRAPYMHDGSLATLRDVVLHYENGFIERPSLSPDMHHLDLSSADVDDLIAFLHTLTSVDSTIAPPELAVVARQ